MKKSFRIEEDLKVINLNDTWKKIIKGIKKARKDESEFVIDLSGMEKADGAGLQTITYLFFLQKEFPKNIELKGLPKSIETKLINMGVSPETREVTA